MRRPPIVALLLLFAATAATAQAPVNDWSPVQQLPPDQPVRVLTDAAIVQAGTLSSVADDSVTLNVGGQDQRIARVPPSARCQSSARAASETSGGDWPLAPLPASSPSASTAPGNLRGPRGRARVVLSHGGGRSGHRRRAAAGNGLAFDLLEETVEGDAALLRGSPQ